MTPGPTNMEKNSNVVAAKLIGKSTVDVELKCDTGAYVCKAIDVPVTVNQGFEGRWVIRGEATFDIPQPFMATAMFIHTPDGLGEHYRLNSRYLEPGDTYRVTFTANLEQEYCGS